MKVSLETSFRIDHALLRISDHDARQYGSRDGEKRALRIAQDRSGASVRRYCSQCRAERRPKQYVGLRAVYDVRRMRNSVFQYVLLDEFHKISLPSYKGPAKSAVFKIYSYALREDIYLGERGDGSKSRQSPWRRMSLPHCAVLFPEALHECWIGLRTSTSAADP